eukprot:5188381-Alexandrium_andersonii.AAC.1
MAGELPGGQPPRATKGCASGPPAFRGTRRERRIAEPKHFYGIRFERKQCKHALCLHRPANNPV